MPKRILQLCLTSWLACGLCMTSFAQATTYRMTFSGQLDSYTNNGGTLPFNVPAMGTDFVLNFVFDPQTTTVMQGFPGLIKVYTAVNSDLAFNGLSFSSTEPELLVFDNVPSEVLTLYRHDVLKTYVDMWAISALLPNGDYIGVELIADADQLPLDAVPKTDFFLPDVTDFAVANILYMNPPNAATLAATVTSLTISQVPLPASGWLLVGSLAGLLRLKTAQRKSRNRV